MAPLYYANHRGAGRVLLGCKGGARNSAEVLGDTRCLTIQLTGGTCALCELCDLLLEQARELARMPLLPPPFGLRVVPRR